LGAAGFDATTPPGWPLLNPFRQRDPTRVTEAGAPSPGAGEAGELPGDGAAGAARTAFRVALPTFEGPLDLLLHLIREHRIDVFDIPIALIAEKYNASLELMQELDLDVAGEFLVMAATLAHIKSRLLLPRSELAPGELEAEPEGDPRAELVQRLLNYQKYREAARQLAEHPLLGRDVFARRYVPDASDRPGPPQLVELSIFRLIEALDRVLKNVAPVPGHEVVRDRVSLSESMERIIARLRAEPEVTFLSLFTGQRTRGSVVVTFLALLEMVRLHLVRIRQSEESQEILVAAQSGALDVPVPEVDEREYR
jgi:segregation and condensation protein A